MVEANSLNGSEKQLRVALIGATGAVGKEIVDAAAVNPAITELIVIVRRKIEEWDNL